MVSVVNVSKILDLLKDLQKYQEENKRLESIRLRDVEEYSKTPPTDTVFYKLAEDGGGDAAELESIMEFLSRGRQDVFENPIIKNDILALLAKIKLMYEESTESYKERRKIHSDFYNRRHSDAIKHNNNLIRAREDSKKKAVGIENRIVDYYEDIIKNLKTSNNDENWGLVRAFCIKFGIDRTNKTFIQMRDSIDWDSVLNLNFNKRMKLMKSVKAILTNTGTV